MPAGPAIGGAQVEFELEGQRFTAVDGGPAYRFTPAVSFMVSCDSQEEIDYFWDRLADEGAPGQCGWLNDKFGLSWQVAPAIFPELMRGASEAVVESVLTITKSNIEQLRAAFQAG